MSCGYKIGRLKNYVYLIKDLKYNVSDYKVYITDGEVYKLFADQVMFTETERFVGRFQFDTTVTVTLNRLLDDSLLRENNFKIVVEDQLGMQFLVSPEFDAKYTSDLTINKNIVSNVLTFNTQSNIPTRILASKITPENNVEEPLCAYYGHGVSKLRVGRNNDWRDVDYLTIDYNRQFDGENTRVQLIFNYPVEDNDWHYKMIRFPDNFWDIELTTSIGMVYDYQLFPQYTRQTQEREVDTFTITLSGLRGSSLLGVTNQDAQYRWIPTNDYICDGFDKYAQEKEQMYENGEWSDTGQFRKGILIETNSEGCGWSINIVFRWLALDPIVNYECVGYNKHFIEKEQMSEDFGGTWADTGRVRTGDLIEANSFDCGYELTEWKEVEGEYYCEEYDPSVTWVLLNYEYICELKTI